MKSLPVSIRMCDRGIGVVAITLACTAFALAQAPTKISRAPQAKVTTLTSPGTSSEPSVAVNPEDSRQVVVAYQVSASIAYSTDAGVHWRHAKNVAPKHFKVSGDPSVTFDNQGHAIFCYIAFNKLGTFNYWGHATTTNGVFVRRSLDGGKTWQPQIAVSEQKRPSAASNEAIPMEDKPYIVADVSHGPYAGNLYIGWTRWSLTDSRMMLSRSTDDGKTWSSPIELDQHPGLPRDDNGALEGFDGAVGADGTLYVVWSDGDHIQFTTSSDGGQTFLVPRDIIHTAPIMFAVQDFDRANGFPQIAVDPRSGNREHARLYVTWSDYRNGDIDVFCATSVDGGEHWSAPVRVNNDPVHDGADQFFQWLTVDPASGAASVIFYDRRDDPSNRKTLVTLARSTNGGKSFDNYAWSVKPFVATGGFMGDYSGIASNGNRVYGAWTETSPCTEKTETSGGATACGPENSQTLVRVAVADFSHSQR